MDEKKKPNLDYGVSLGGLLKGFGDFIEQIAQVVDEEDGEIHKSGEFTIGESELQRGMYGVSVSVNRGGVPEIRKFGKKISSEVREPLIDIIEEKDAYHIVAEIPGVRESEISILVEDKQVTLSAGHGERVYSKIVELEHTITGDPSWTYNNGILEITLEKA